MPVITCLSADSKMFIRGKFKACLGVVVTFENQDEFKKEYYSFFNELKEKYFIKNPRNVFKSFDLKKIFSYVDFPKIVENFIEYLINNK